MMMMIITIISMKLIDKTELIVIKTVTTIEITVTIEGVISADQEQKTISNASNLIQHRTKF
jgi:hypothetical protein